VENLKRLKKETIEWDTLKHERDDRELKDTKLALQAINETVDGGFYSVETKENLVQLEQKKRKLLEENEATWTLKSRAIWLEK